MTNMKFIVLLPIVIFLTIHFDFIEGRSINLKKNFHQFKDNITKSNIECGVNYKCTDCSDSSYIGKINSLTISPDPPSRPTITVEASLSLDRTDYNVCEISEPTCPADGDINVKFSKEIPSISPDGDYTGNAKATGLNENGEEKSLICIDLEFKL